MDTYASLFIDIKNADCRLDIPLSPVNIGDVLYDKKGRKCEVVQLGEKAFRYIFLNKSYETPSIKKWCNYGQLKNLFNTEFKRFGK